MGLYDGVDEEGVLVHIYLYLGSAIGWRFGVGSERFGWMDYWHCRYD